MICFRAGHLLIWVRFFVMCVSFHSLIICVYIYIYILNDSSISCLSVSFFDVSTPSFAFTVINNINLHPMINEPSRL